MTLKKTGKQALTRVSRWTLTTRRHRFLFTMFLHRTETKGLHTLTDTPSQKNAYLIYTRGVVQCICNQWAKHQQVTRVCKMPKNAKQRSTSTLTSLDSENTKSNSDICTIMAPLPHFLLPSPAKIENTKTDYIWNVNVLPPRMISANSHNHLLKLCHFKKVNYKSRTTDL